MLPGGVRGQGRGLRFERGLLRRGSMRAQRGCWRGAAVRLLRRAMRGELWCVHDVCRLLPGLVLHLAVRKLARAVRALRRRHGVERCEQRNRYRVEWRERRYRYGVERREQRSLVER
jgi:hypothetical protein